MYQKARGGFGDSKQTLEVCKDAVDDHEDMIVKALCWALRELAKIEGKPVAEFIERKQIVEQITKSERSRVSRSSQNQANPAPSFGSLVPLLCVGKDKPGCKKINHAISHITKKGGTYESYRT